MLKSSPWGWLRVQARAAWALLLALALAALASAQPVRWLGYEDALARAAVEGKPVYIYFYSKSCPYCEMMEENTFPNASVNEMLNTRFIPVRVDVERRPGLASTYWIPGTPFHVFLCPNGSLLGVASGYRNPDGFLKLLNTALAKTEEKCANQAATLRVGFQTMLQKRVSREPSASLRLSRSDCSHR